jgi:uncharacterized protein YbjT (DUF2867 family)
MKVILFGATGMVGQGVLRECLLDDGVQSVLSVGRTALTQVHAKLGNLVHADLYDYSTIENQLKDYDACFFCLGVSASGMSEAQYHRITYDLTLAAAQTLSRLNPQMSFVYVTGMGTDNSEKGRSMWARVKGKTENALLRLPFKAAYMFRPGMIQPLHGIKSKTGLYRALYVAMTPLMPLMKAIAPSSITTTEQVGRAMIKVARVGYDKKVLEASDINSV